QAREAVFARRIVGGAAERDEVHLRDRHLVQLDDPHRQAVRQLLLLNRRRSNGGRRSRLRRTRTIGRLLGGERTTAQCDDNGNQRCSHNSPYGFFSGSTVNSTRLSSGRNCAAAALMSPTDNARYRARSSLNQSGSPV